MPTDTVYGFIADATNKKAVAKIYKIKQRPKDKPLPVFVSGVKMAQEIAEVDARAKKMFKKFWPGAYTFVLPRKDNVLLNFAGVKKGRMYGVDKKTIALRVPKNIFLLKILKEFGRPLVQTSVNLAGQESLNSAEAIYEVFGKNHLAGLIIDGRMPKNAKSSKIIDLTGEHLTRIR